MLVVCNSITKYQGEESCDKRQQNDNDDGGGGDGGAGRGAICQAAWPLAHIKLSFHAYLHAAGQSGGW